MQSLVMIRDGDFFRSVLSAPVPVLCFFQAEAADPSELEASIAVLNRTLWKLIDGYAMRAAIVNERLTPGLIRQHCRHDALPLLRLYRLGREFATCPFDGRGIDAQTARRCGLVFQVALEAPWNQPGIDPQAFRMPEVE